MNHTQGLLRDLSLNLMTNVQRSVENGHTDNSFVAMDE